MDGLLTVGRLAAEADLSPHAIRYYESVGLIPAPARSEAGYRLYPRSELRRLQLISRAKMLGLSLAEIKALVDETFSGSCVHLQAALLSRIPVQIRKIDQRIEELQSLRSELTALVDHLAGLNITESDQVSECESCSCLTGAERG